MDINFNDLLAKAISARENSYSPYSHFPVGAAVLTKDGEVYFGANIENASYPLCLCAERNAIYNAMNHGRKKSDLVALAVVADTDGPCSPCGACRQVISELLLPETPIVMGNLKGESRLTSPKELLPFAFTLEDLK